MGVEVHTLYPSTNHYKGAQELGECLLRYRALQRQPPQEALLGTVLLRRHLGVSARGTLCTKVCVLCPFILCSLATFSLLPFLPSFFFFPGDEKRDAMLAALPNQRWASVQKRFAYYTIPAF